jgi:hypothetical protein
MPVLFVAVARLRDRLVLTSTLDEDQGLAPIKAEAKAFCQTISSTSQPRITRRLLTSNLHVCVASPVFAYCATDCEFDPQSAYQLLDQSIQAFTREYGEAIDAVEQEHVFIDFYATLDQIRAKFAHQVADSQLGRVRRELSGVQESMAGNIRTALIRQEKLDEVGEMSEGLSRKASAFQKDATDLNRLYLWRTYGRPAVVVSLVSLVYLFVSLFLV